MCRRPAASRYQPAPACVTFTSVTLPVIAFRASGDRYLSPVILLTQPFSARLFVIFDTCTRTLSFVLISESAVQPVRNMFAIKTVVTQDGASVNSCENMFEDRVNLTSADLRYLDTSEVVSMSWMFDGCRSLTHVDVSNFNTTDVEYMREMFNNSRKLCELDLSSFHAIDDGVWMDGMFGGCNRLFRLKIGNFAPSLAYTEYMFFGCISLSELEISDRVLMGDAEYDLRTAEPLR